MLALFRRARVLAALGAAGIAFSLAPAAHAESTADAEAKARALLDQVRQMQEQVKRAEARYDAALGGVAASVTAAIQTDRASEHAAARTAAAAAQLDDRIRGLYMSGGPLALYASALESGDITEMQSRVIVWGRWSTQTRTSYEPLGIRPRRSRRWPGGHRPLRIDRSRPSATSATL